MEEYGSRREVGAARGLPRRACAARLLPPRGGPRLLAIRRGDALLRPDVLAGGAAVLTGAAVRVARTEALQVSRDNLPAQRFPTNRQMVALIPQIDRWWLLFFPNDLRCGFRKLKERGVGNRTSGAVLVPKSLLVLSL